MKLAAKCAFASVLTFATERTARKGIAAHIVSHGNALELRALLRRARRTPCQAEAAGPPVRPVPHVMLRNDCECPRGGWPTRRSSRRTAGRPFPLRSPSALVVLPRPQSHQDRQGLPCRKAVDERPIEDSDHPRSSGYRRVGRRGNRPQCRPQNPGDRLPGTGCLRRMVNQARRRIDERSPTPRARRKGRG